MHHQKHSHLLVESVMRQLEGSKKCNQIHINKTLHQNGDFYNHIKHTSYNDFKGCHHSVNMPPLPQCPSNVDCSYRTEEAMLSASQTDIQTCRKIDKGCSRQVNQGHTSDSETDLALSPSPGALGPLSIPNHHVFMWGGEVRGRGRLLGPAEELLDVGLQVFGEKLVAVAPEGLSVTAHQELLEVPGHVCAGHGTPDDVLGVGHEGSSVVRRNWELLPEEGEKRVGVLAVDIGLLQEGDLGLKAFAWTDILKAIQDLVVVSILLVGKDKASSSPPSH